MYLAHMKAYSPIFLDFMRYMTNTIIMMAITRATTSTTVTTPAMMILEVLSEAGKEGENATN